MPEETLLRKAAVVLLLLDVGGRIVDLTRRGDDKGRKGKIDEGAINWFPKGTAPSTTRGNWEEGYGLRLTTYD